MSDLTELAHLPATEALRRFRDRSLSPVGLMTAVLARPKPFETIETARPGNSVPAL